MKKPGKRSKAIQEELDKNNPWKVWCKKDPAKPRWQYAQVCSMNEYFKGCTVSDCDIKRRRLL